MPLGIIYPNFILLGQKMGSRPKKSIFKKKKSKIAEKTKNGHILAVNSPRPKPFGG